MDYLDRFRETVIDSMMGYIKDRYPHFDDDMLFARADTAFEVACMSLPFGHPEEATLEDMKRLARDWVDATDLEAC